MVGERRKGRKKERKGEKKEGMERKGEEKEEGRRREVENEEEEEGERTITVMNSLSTSYCHKARFTFGSCFPFPVRTKRGRENGGWLSERLDVDLLLSVSSLLTGRPILGSKVNKTQQFTCMLYTLQLNTSVTMTTKAFMKTSAKFSF